MRPDPGQREGRAPEVHQEVPASLPAREWSRHYQCRHVGPSSQGGGQFGFSGRQRDEGEVHARTSPITSGSHSPGV